MDIPGNVLAVANVLCKDDVTAGMGNEPTRVVGASGIWPCDFIEVVDAITACAARSSAARSTLAQAIPGDVASRRSHN